MNSFTHLYLTMAWRNIWRNKRRTLITMASIVFAVVLAVLLNSVKEGFLLKMQENVVSFYTGAVQVHEPGYWDDKTLDNTFVVSEELKSDILSDDQVVAIAPRLESYALAASETHTKGCMIVGIDPLTEPKITKLNDKLVKGSYLKPGDDEALLTKGLASYLNLQVGDTLVVIGQGYHGISAAGKFRIKGIIEMASPELNKRMVYLPIAVAQELFGAEDRSTAIVVKLDNINKATEVAERLSQVLPSHEVMDWKTLLPELNSVLEGERAENVIFLLVLYLLISFGIFGTILMMLMERQFEFGVLVAIGMQNINLTWVIILENVFISLIGALVGTLLSVPVILYFYFFPIKIGGELKDVYENYGFEPIFYFSVEPSIFYSQSLVILTIALVLSIYPLFKLIRLDPIMAMRK